MSTFTVDVMTIDAIEEHDNADALEIAVLGGYRSIVRKDVFNAGDPVVYIPEASIVPVWLLKELNLFNEEKGAGMLAGKAGNRVKAVKLRGVVSQGLIYRVTPVGPKAVEMKVDDENMRVLIGEDVKTVLGIEKYVPEIPARMSGEVTHALNTGNFDVENVQKFPDVFVDGESVVVTEKLHGTQVQFGYVPGNGNPAMLDEDFIISSKGMAKKNLALKYNETNRTRNLYIRTFEQKISPVKDEVKAISAENENSPIWIFGEIFGKGVQDLGYERERPDYRVFAIVMEDKNGKFFVSHDKMMEITTRLGLDVVPVFYVGPYSYDKVVSFRDGKTTFGEGHIREGVVVRKNVERLEAGDELAFMKFISPDYLLRKGNTTEFE